MSAILFALVAACAPPPIQGGGGTPTQSETGTGSSLVPVSSVPIQWTAAAGWLLLSADVVGDVNGDGFVDAVVSAQAEGVQAATLFLVNGPLLMSKTLPGDEDASVADAGLASYGYAPGVSKFGDATGDGLADLYVTSGETGYLLTGVLTGVLDLGSATLVSPAGEFATLADYDGDGVLDLARFAPAPAAELDLTWGPASRWVGQPDAIVSPDCASGEGWSTSGSGVWPDVTGDSVPELWIPGYADPASCGSLIMPVPSGGLFAPAPGAQDLHNGIEPFQVVPDQTGDGLSDVYLSVAREIVPAPVTFDDGSATSAFERGDVTGSSVISIDAASGQLVSLGFDVTGDGIADFLDNELKSDTSVTGLPGSSGGTFSNELFVAAGGSALSIINRDAGWSAPNGLVGDAGAFVEDGSGHALVVTSSSIAVVDLGIASGGP